MTFAPHILAQLEDNCIGFANLVILKSDKNPVYMELSAHMLLINACMPETVGIRARRGVGSRAPKVEPLRIT